MPEQTPNGSRQPRLWGVAGLIVLILGIVTVIWQVAGKLGPPQRKPEDPPRDHSEESFAFDKQRLWESKERGVALLENHQYREASELFEKIAAALPDDPLGPRNFAVAQLSLLETKETTFEKAWAALQRLEQLEPHAVSTVIFAAKMLASTGDRAGAVERLQQFTKRSPDQVSVWFELGALQRDAKDENLRRQAAASFQHVLELAPDSLAALWNLLQFQAADELPEVADTLRRARLLAEPLRIPAQESGVDLDEQIAAALRAADQGMTEELYRRAFIVANVIKAQPLTRRENLKISPHSLAYVLQEFQPEFHVGWSPPAVSANDNSDSDAITVTFAVSPTAAPLASLGKMHDFILADFDLDQRPDLIVLSGGRVEIFGRGDRDSAWTTLCTAAVPQGMRRILAADLDEDVEEDPRQTADGCHDADIDLIIVGDPGTVVLENQLDPATAKRSLVEVEQTAEFQNLREISAAVVLDFDHDAMLDLVIAAGGKISLWQNRGSGKFRRSSTIDDGGDRFDPRIMIALDWDRDIDLDVILAGDRNHSAGLLKNHRHGRFSSQAWDGDDTALRSANSLAVLDVDGNLGWDLVAAGDEGLALIRTEILDSTVVREIDSTRLTDRPADGILTWDYDNDGSLDLLAWNHDGLQILRGQPDGEFLTLPDLLQPPPISITKCEVGDVDHDGDLDLFVATETGIMSYENQGGNQNHWLKIRLLAEQAKGGGAPDPGGRVNYHGIGSLLELRTGTGYLPRMVTGQVTHFGLGQQEQVERVRILWANGFPQNIIKPPADSNICDRKLLLGSCPYLYTWSGQQFEFYTDLCWAAPLGLKFADGVYAPSRSWEYLKISGERLQPRDGAYQLQVTEELWEAAYFDLISLIAVDHPADVEIYSNEKVGPAEIADYQIHTVRNPRPPVSARDKFGRDLRPELLHNDGVYCKPFEKRIKQGLVEDHYLELDLGDLADAQQITLFLTGWVYPTDTSLNLRLDRDAELPSPKPPSLWVPDENGNWRETMPYTGFPGGKTKTIAVDISRAFLCDDFRLRLATNMEFYWDAAFFTTDELPSEIRTTELTLRAADLHDRGYSAIEHPTDHGPDRYVYQRLQKDFGWPPLRGHFTRYGDVAELLTATDDRMAIIGAGDEITLTFEMPQEPLPPGWKRDFVLHNVGWDKDANLNTAYGQDVEPLPFGGMSSYPYPAGESYPFTAAHRAYLQKYQTRVQSWRRFWRDIAGETSRQVP